jgi:uncharacterized membrane protein
MSPTAWILLLWLAFTATHVGLASVRVEPGLRRRLGDAGFLGIYSAVSLAFFVPLVWIYFANRHAGSWLWAVSVGPVLRTFLYLGITFGLVLVVGALAKPSPAAVVPGEARVAGVYRITRHPFVLGLAVVWALHLIPNGSSADIAFFGGFLVFSLLGAWHQDRRKLAAGSPEFRRFYAETSFLPFAGSGSLRGVREIPPWVMLGGFALAFAIRWLHGSIWPH